MSQSKYRQQDVRAPRGTTLNAKSWLTEAPLRMLMNNLDPDVAENPHELVVYGGIGRAARNWECYDAIVKALKNLESDETLLVQSGKPVGVFKTHENSPRVLIANSNLVPHWATWEHFNELDAKGLAMYGQMTAGSWIYIGSQGIVQGTYETFVEAGRQHYNGSLRGRWVLTAGLGGMGGAQPLAATLAGACSLNIECQQSRIDFRLRTRYVDEQAPWVVAKQEGRDADLQAICTMGLNMFRVLMTWLKPVLPQLAARAEAFLNSELSWDAIQQPLLAHKVNPFKALYNRIEMKQVEALVEASKEEVKATAAPVTGPLADDPIQETITFDDFAKVDLRVALIENAEFVEGSDKLLRLTLDLGGEKRNVFSGIRSAYPDPQPLIGRLTVMVANLAPRKMRFGISEGMVMAAGPGGKDIFLLSPDDGAKPGQQVK